VSDKAPASSTTAYAFPRRLATLFAVLGLILAIISIAMAVFTLIGRVPNGAHALAPAVIGLGMAVFGHIAIAVFDIADAVCGADRGGGP
jgi:hypothetical protein